MSGLRAPRRNHRPVTGVVMHAASYLLMYYLLMYTYISRCTALKEGTTQGDPMSIIGVQNLRSGRAAVDPRGEA